MEYSLIDLANIKLSFWEWFLVAFYFIFILMILPAGWRQLRGPPHSTPVPPAPPRWTRTDD